MQVKKSNVSETSIELQVVADKEFIRSAKESVLRRLAKTMNLPGFRKGKVPIDLVEKNLEPSMVQTEFLEQAINELYIQAADQEKLRPVSRPEIEITKFVPYDVLEFTAKIEVIGDIKLPDYTTLKVSRPNMTVTDDDVKAVISDLQKRQSDKKTVDRASQEGDEVWIDFEGRNEKDEPVKGADGKDYPIIIGSNTFIPGFEPNLVGLKAGEDKTFDVTFPKDYGVKALQNKKVTFKVKINKVEEISLPEANDEFAAKVGPFKSLEELKKDIRNQLEIERTSQLEREYESEIVKAIADKTEVSIPKTLIDEQVDRLMNEVRQNLMYRGQTLQEFLESENKTEAEYRQSELEPQAQERVKAGLALSEIAEKEKITVEPEELEIRMQMLKGQYKDEAMQAEMDKPENRRDIAGRMLTEKTLEKLKSLLAADKK